MVNAAKNRRELITAGLTSRRDLMKLGLLTAGGMLVAKSGLSARAYGQQQAIPPSILFTACAQFATGSSAAVGVETSALTPIFSCALLLDDRRLLPLGAPIPQNAAVPSLAPRRPARPCPAVFLICWLSLLHADARQGLILFPFAHSRSKPTRSAPRAVFHSYPRG
jgi:hypothetical protein